MDPQGRVAADTIAEGISQMEELSVVSFSAQPERSRSQGGEQEEPQGVAYIQRLARQAGAGIVITGAYYLIGHGPRFSAKMNDGQTGKLISSVSSDFGTLEKSDEGDRSFVDIILDLRQRVMGVLAARRDPYMAEILSLRPPTYEAYQEYRFGWEYFASNYDQSIQHFQRSYELDPTFILPLLFKSIVYTNTYRHEDTQAVLDQINLQRNQLTEFDLFILDHLLYELQGNQSKALSTLRQAEKKFPDSFLIQDWIGLASIYLNRPQEALDSLSKIDMDAQSELTAPASSWSMGRIIQASHMLGDYENEWVAIQKAKKLFPDRIWRTHKVRVLAALGKIKDVQEYVDESFAGLSKAGDPSDVATEAVEELRVRGYMEEAQIIADRLADWAQKQMPADPSEGELRGFANRLYRAQRWDEAGAIYKKLAETYEESILDFFYAARLGCIAARIGDIEEASRISEKLEKMNRPFLLGRHTYNRARIASLLGEKQQAVDLLQQAMREGLSFGIDVIQDQDFLPLKDFPPFQEFIKPKG
jgi:tetratricopeptide (TPR) repeat protein